MADSTLAALTAATAATGGLYYGTQAGADRKFTMTAAGATLAEAANAAAQVTALSVLPLAGGTLSGLLNFSDTTHAGIRLNSLTTTQRNALTAGAGDFLFNSTLSQFQGYTGAAWASMATLGANTFDGAQTLSEVLGTELAATTAAGYTYAGATTATDGPLVFTRTASASNLTITQITQTVVAGTIYKVAWTAGGSCAGTVTVTIGDRVGATVSHVSGTTYTEYLRATGTGKLTFTFVAATTGTISGITCKAMTPSTAACPFTFSRQIEITDTTASTSSTTGAGKIAGGLGVAGKICAASFGRADGTVLTDGFNFYPQGANSGLIGMTTNCVLGNSSNNYLLTLRGASGLFSDSAGAFGFTDGTSYNGTLSSWFKYGGAAACIQMGDDSPSAPLGQHFKAPNMITNDGVGGTLTLSGGNGVGSNYGGSIYLATYGQALAATTASVADPANDKIQSTAHGLSAGYKVRFTTTGTLPGGLSLATTYYVIATNLSANEFMVSATLGGSTVNITSTGTGTHTVRQYGGLLTTRWTVDSLALLPGSGMDIGATSYNVNAIYSTSYYSGTDKVVGARLAAVADATGGVVIDDEARAAINDLLARIRTHGLIAS